MPQRDPRHLAEHRLPWRLMLVAFGLTFAVLAALVASAAFVPEGPLVPSPVSAIPGDTMAPVPTDPAPSVAPSSAGGRESSTTTTTPAPPPGAAPVVAALGPATTAPEATPRPTRPPATDPPAAAPSSSSTTEPEPQPAPVSTFEATTTTVGPTTTTVEPTTTTATLDPTTTTGGATTTTLPLVVLPPGGEQAAGALLAPLFGLLYLLRGLLPGPAGRHARPGRYRLPQVRSRRATRRPPARARTRP
jgi:hypothetical protein